ncbi:MAG TPA: DUF6585 family protein [Gemmataceae bacterium]|nr:DUF6585 family protein [Gemmataceae bacterium]
MDEEYEKPRDPDMDLAEITSRLGEPDATYRTNVSSVVWRFVLGVLIVIGAAALHYLMWSNQIPWPRAHHWKLWVILLFGMFVGPGVGLYLITFAVRGLKLWVLTYPTGLFIWHRGKVIAFPWDDIRAIQFSGLPEKGILNRPPGPDGRPASVWYDLEKSRRRVFGTTIHLTRADGEQVGLPSTLDGFPELGRRVQEETYRRLFPVHWAELEDGQTLEFGPITCDAGGITVGKDRLPWDEVDVLERASDKLEIKKVGKKKVWAKCDLSDLVNPHVLMGMAAAARGPTPPTS